MRFVVYSAYIATVPQALYVCCDCNPNTTRTRKPSWCWHTRATQKRWKKFLHFEV